MTTPRPHARTLRAAAVMTLAVAGLMSLGGCDPRTLMYFLQSEEPTIPPPKDAPKLDGKKVVVVTHTVSGAMSEFQSLDRDISKKVVSILKEKVEKVNMVDSEKVWNWLEDHPSWTDPEEIAKAFDADYVIFFEVELFQVQNPGDIGVLQGTSRTHIQVTELAYPKNAKGKPDKKEPKEGNQIYDAYADTVFPTRGPTQADAGVSRGAFKNRFLGVVAAELSWHFVGHPTDDDIQDVRGL